MSLLAGARLGPYEITAAIGAGGMGEVYRARDTRLDRTVAIKILPSQLAGDPQFRDRFDREARTISQLTHANICTLYDVGEAGDGPPGHATHFLVMEYLEGETLSVRLARGRLPVSDALRIASEIASALDQAHRHGIVHRDLKPGNAMLTKGGAKLLDFGLAKEQPGGAVDVLATGAPTAAASLTAQGTILGTVQYMAPEQIEGREADARTDIFALGVVLYEMLTGRPPFEGNSPASLLGAILKDDPPPLSNALPVTPPVLDHLVRRCLAKDSDERWQTAADLHRELKWVAESLTIASARGEVVPRRVGFWRRPTPLSVSIAAAVLLGLLGATVASVWKRGAAAVSSRVSRLTILLPPGQQLDRGFPPVAISPSGMHVAYVGIGDGRQQLYLRAINEQEIRPLAGTDWATSPFFSPDGQWVGFFSQGKLKKVSVSAGIIQTMCDAGGSGGSWAPDEFIYFAPGPNSGLFKVSASGGTPIEVTRLERARGEISHRWPEVLPGGKAVLFTMWTGPGQDEKHVAAQRLDTGQRVTVIEGGQTGHYVASGHLVYARADELFAVRFNPDSLQTTGQAVRLADSVLVGNQGAHFAASETGDLVLVPGDPRRLDRRLVWVTRNGGVEPVSAPVRPYAGTVAISPDGRFAAVDVLEESINIWVYDFSRATLTPLIKGSGSSQVPRWTPDGTRIVYRGTRRGFRNLWWAAVSQPAAEERLTDGASAGTPSSWSKDGKRLFYQSDADIWMLPVADERKPRPIVQSPADEGHPRLSPDSRWLAYTSNVSGRTEVFVQPFPGPGPRVQISTDFGIEPIWSPDGRELFYMGGDTKLMAVNITTTPTFKAGMPRVLVEGRYMYNSNHAAGYDVSPDGRRFLRVQPLHPDPLPNQINVVLNWLEELRRVLPN
jgi:Tol biopolymer transport system component